MEKESKHNSANVTEMLIKWNQGDAEAQASLMKIIYNELHDRAKIYMQYERPDHTLQATVLVHEVYLRLINQKDVQWQNRTQFYAVAAQMMRRILVDYGRSRQADKRGGDKIKLSLDEALEISDQKDMDLCLLDEALNELTQLDERQGKIVELRYFGGLSVEETAEVLNISTATVTREWRIARMWLYNTLKKSRS